MILIKLGQSTPGTRGETDITSNEEDTRCISCLTMTALIPLVLFIHTGGDQNYLQKSRPRAPPESQAKMRNP